MANSVGSLRAVNSSVRAVATKGKRPLRSRTPVPHAEILDFVREPLAGRDIDLQIEIFESFDEPNDLLVAGRLHANFFQYLPFLDDFNRRSGNRLVPVAPVHIDHSVLLGVHTDIDAIPEFAEVALPLDPVNLIRSLTMSTAWPDRLRTPRRSLATVADVRSSCAAACSRKQTSWLLGGLREDFDVVFLFGNQVAMEWGVETAGACPAIRGPPHTP